MFRTLGVGLGVQGFGLGIIREPSNQVLENLDFKTRFRFMALLGQSPQALSIERSCFPEAEIPKP